MIANYSGNKERANAATIGAALGVLQGGVFAGIYALTKKFPKLNESLIVKWNTKTIANWIERAKNYMPTKSPQLQKLIGSATAITWLAVSGAALGFIYDVFRTFSNTRINGKVTKTKQGRLDDSWVVSGLNSLSYTKEGQKVIKDAIKRNSDNTISVKLKGVNKEYTITKKELRAASKAYLVSMDSNGKVKGYAKKYSKGDGDVLAFELAMEKFRNDVQDGKINQKLLLPSYAYNELKDKNNPINSGSSNQLYYLLTGKTCGNINMQQNQNLGITKGLDVSRYYSEKQLNNFLSDASLNKDKYAASATIKEPKVIYGLKNERIKLNSQTSYAIKSVNDKTVTLINPKQYNKNLEIPIEAFKENLSSLNYVSLKESGGEA